MAALLTFEQRQVATLVTSFDVQATRIPHLEVYGTDATLVLPDPNFHDGTVYLRRRGDQGWQELPAGRPPPPTAGQPSSPPGGRGLGVLDLARALRGRDQQRATGELGYHVLDVMLAIRRSATRGQADRVASSCPQPAPR